MSGIGMAASSGATAAPSNPLIVSISLTGGDTYHVSGASGDLGSAFGSLISLSSTGGVPPVSLGRSVTKDAGTGNVSVGASTGGGDSIFWSGMLVGNSLLCHLDGTATDSASHSDSQRYPLAGGAFISITRDS